MFTSLKNILQNVRKISWQRFYESGKTVFSILGVGSTLAYIGTMHLVVGLLSSILVGGTWYGIYRASIVVSWE